MQSEIENSLPSANPTAAIQNTPCVQELKKLMEEVETIKAERDTIEDEIKEAQFDMCKTIGWYPIRIQANQDLCS